MKDNSLHGRQHRRSRRGLRGASPPRGLSARETAMTIDPAAATPTEMMTIAAARVLKNTDVCFVGIWRALGPHATWRG